MRQTITQTGLSLTVTLIGLVAAAPVAAQGLPVEICTKIESDAERLACFDAALTEQSDAATETDQSAAPTTVPAATATQQPPAAKASPELPAESAQTVSETPAQATELPRQPDEQPAIEQDLRREYQAVVVAMYKRPYGQMAVTLDNGEVWSERFASRSFLVDVGDTITMKRVRFSSGYRLVAPGGRGYKMTRLE
jgi:hypothetical protein